MVMAKPPPRPATSRPGPPVGAEGWGKEGSVQRGPGGPGVPEGPKQQETPQRGPQVHRPPHHGQSPGGPLCPEAPVGQQVEDQQQSVERGAGPRGGGLPPRSPSGSMGQACGWKALSRGRPRGREGPGAESSSSAPRGPPARVSDPSAPKPPVRDGDSASPGGARSAAECRSGPGRCRERECLLWAAERQLSSSGANTGHNVCQHTAVHGETEGLSGGRSRLANTPGEGSPTGG